MQEALLSTAPDSSSPPAGQGSFKARLAGQAVSGGEQVALLIRLLAKEAVSPATAAPTRWNAAAVVPSLQPP